MCPARDPDSIHRGVISPWSTPVELDNIGASRWKRLAEPLSPVDVVVPFEFPPDPSQLSW